MKVLLGPHAVQDLRSARDHYDEIDPALGTAFAAAFDLLVERIEIFPHGAAPVEGFAGVRRARMRRFPYGVFYSDDAETNDQVVILRVLHAAQDTARHLQGQ